MAPHSRKTLKTCKTCQHPERDQIEADWLFQRLTRGAKSRGEADGFWDKYNIHSQSIRTHMEKHVPMDDLNLIYAAEREKAAKGLIESDRTDVVTTLHKLSAEAESFLTQAKDDKDLRGGLAAVAELRRQIELTARLLGQLGENNSTLILAKHPEFIKVRTIILEVLEEHPQAKATFLQRIGTAAIGHEEEPEEKRGGTMVENRKKRWPTR